MTQGIAILKVQQVETDFGLPAIPFSILTGQGKKEIQMAVTLQKGGNVSLSKEAPGLTKVTVGLGWDPRLTDGAEFDLAGGIASFIISSMCV